MRQCRAQGLTAYRCDGAMRNPDRAVARNALGFLVFVPNPVSTGAAHLPHAGPMEPIFETCQPCLKVGAVAAVFDLQGARSSPSFDRLWRHVLALLGAHW